MMSRRTHPFRRHLRLQSLERRAIPATFTVTNVGDSGIGSFRQAILDANSHAGMDIIAFSISGTGIHTITPASEFPPITDPLFINGYSQSGTLPATVTSHAILK